MFLKTNNKFNKVKEFMLDLDKTALLFKELDRNSPKRYISKINNNTNKEINLINSYQDYFFSKLVIGRNYYWVNLYQIKEGYFYKSIRIHKDNLTLKECDFSVIDSHKQNHLLIRKGDKLDSSKSITGFIKEKYEESIIWEQGFSTGRYVIEDSKIYGIHAKTNNKLRHDRLFCIDIETGKILWEYQHPYELDAEKPGIMVIGKIIGIHNGKVYLSVKGRKYESEWTSPVGKKFTYLLGTGNLVVLDAETGNVETIQPFPFYKDRRPSFLGLLRSGGGTLGLDKRRNRLVMLFSDHYFEMDLEDYSIKYWDMEEEFKPYVCTCVGVKAEIFGDHLFFLSDMRGNIEDTTSYRQIAALNLNTKKIDWEHTFNDEISIEDFKITDEKLYVLWGKELHIFEKT